MSAARHSDVDVTEIDPDLAAHFDQALVDEVQGHPRPVTDDGRVEVKNGNDLDRIYDVCSRALGADPLVFERTHELVTVVGSAQSSAPEAPPSSLGSRLAPGTPVIRPLNVHSLRPRFTRHIKFLRTIKPTAKERAQAACLGEEPPPKWGESLPTADILNGILSLGDFPGVRSLAGLLEAPSMRPDGSLILKPGYDDATGFLYLPAQPFGVVPSEPTQSDATRALADLCDAFVDFPFASEASRYVPIAALLTLLARPAILGPVPAHVFDASTPGSGKSLMADAVCMIGTGRAAPRGTFPIQREELEKILASYAVAGASVVGFDNIESVFGGAALDKYLSAVDTVDLRVLGQTHKLTMQWRALVVASGNNIAVVGDTARRVILCRLEPSTDRPEERVDFKHYPLLAWVRENRAHLVVAALTILRAHVLAGSPSCDVKLWGTFESWSSIVASAIVYAGGANVLGARPSEEAGDSGERGAVVALMSGLKRLDADDKGYTVRELLKLLYPAGRAPSPDVPPDGYDALREAIEALARPKPGMMPDASRLGLELRRWRARYVGSQRLVSRSAGGGIARWHVEG